MGQPEEEVYAKPRKKARNPETGVMEANGSSSSRRKQSGFIDDADRSSMMQIKHVHKLYQQWGCLWPWWASPGKGEKEETRGGDSFKKFGGEWGERAKAYIVSSDPHNNLMTY